MKPLPLFAPRLSFSFLSSWLYSHCLSIILHGPNHAWPPDEPEEVIHLPGDLEVFQGMPARCWWLHLQFSPQVGLELFSFYAMSCRQWDTARLLGSLLLHFHAFSCSSLSPYCICVAFYTSFSCPCFGGHGNHGAVTVWCIYRFHLQWRRDVAVFHPIPLIIALSLNFTWKMLLSVMGPINTHYPRWPSHDAMLYCFLTQHC